jgi:hypothetical protein
LRAFASWFAGYKNAANLAAHVVAIKAPAALRMGAAPVDLIVGVALAAKIKVNIAPAAKVLLKVATAVQNAHVAPAADINLSDRNFAHSFIRFLRIYRFGGFFISAKSGA